MAVSLKSKHDAGPRNVEVQTDGTFRETVSLYAYGSDYGDTPVKADANGALFVSGGLADDAAFTPGTSRVFAMGAFFDDVAPDSVNENDIGAPRMSGNRVLYGQLRDAAGNERGANVTAANELNVLETNSGAIKTAVELIDNAISGTEMQVDVVAALPAGTNNIGDVDVLTQVGAANLANGQVAASTTAGTLVAARATRRSVTIRNLSATISVYVGVATVTSGNGMLLKAEESITLETTALVQVIAASGTPTVAYVEVYD